jgi:hypothetical protein
MCASREWEQIDQDKTPEFTIALVSCDEDLLFAVLSNCVSGNDVDTFVENSFLMSRVKDKVRLYDEATVARCKEAMDIREDLQAHGYLDIARTITRTRADERSHPLVRLLQNMGPPKLNPSLHDDSNVV